MFRLGQHVTVEQFYKYATKYATLGMELSKTVCYDCDLADEDYECSCENNPYTITLRYSLVDFPDIEDYVDDYVDYFPSGLTLKPGYIWDSEENGVYPLMGAWDYVSREYTISKLPVLKLLKRKEI